MQRLGVLRRLGGMRLHNLEDEEVISINGSVVGELTFEVGVVLRDERRLHLLGRLRRQGEVFEPRSRLAVSGFAVQSVATGLSGATRTSCSRIFTTSAVSIACTGGAPMMGPA